MHQIFLRNMGFTDINPCDLGYQKCQSGHSYGFSIRNYYLLHYVKSGEGIFISGDTEYKVGAGEVFLIRPGEITKYTADKKNPWHYIWIGFDGELANKLDEMESPVFKTDIRVFEMLMRADEYKNMREQYVTSCVHVLLCEIFEKAAVTDNVLYIKNYIETHYMSDPRIEELADTVRMNRKYLARIFKERVGKTMREYISECRMKEAKKLLIKGFNVNETAEMLGYSDQSTFSRAYKNYYGNSPTSVNKKCP